MDFTPIFSQAFTTLWYLIPLLIFTSIIKSAWFKGVFGEFQVNAAFKLFLPKDEYHLIKNVTLPTEDGTTQIDHVIVSRYGIFVVETKNMKGWIFGGTNQRQWTQKIFKYSTKFQNPLYQNYKHTKTIETGLSINKETIFSIIVFVGDCTFKTQMPDNVTYAGGCIRYIKSQTKVLFSQPEVAEIIDKIESNRLQRGFKTNIQHIAHVKKVIEKKDKPKVSKACPRCGSNMVVRQAKKNANAGQQFWGCSTFPKCRAIVNIT